ncbi:acyltransferase family protein [Arenimonas sp.]|uniref:acyltransferase family protein n=1 Tax=Arenimonas sp. TaxID=1872635 RepID=UPI0035AEE685
MPDAPSPRPWWGTAALSANRIPGQDNALPLRHLASLMVIYGHSYDLSAPMGQADLVARTMPGFKAGTLAVYVFFTLSGFLLMLSMQRHPGFLRYAWHRFLRIFPAYWVMLLTTVLLLGPVATTLATGDYFSHGDTWRHLRENLLPLSFNWQLPGVFEANPLPGVINGSLWSLGLELRWYAYLGLLLLLGAVARRPVFTAIALAFVGFAAWEWTIGKPDPLHYRALSVTFMLAALVAQWRDRLPLSTPLLLATMGAAALLHESRWFGPLATLAVIYGVLVITYRLPVWRWSASRDYSYGLFLYGFPVQQALLAAWPSVPPLALFACATLLAALLAALSWHLVERPALGFKRGRPAMPPAAGAVYQTRSSGTW